jgi:hypothetical protein
MRQLFIDSRDAVPGGTSTNFVIQLREQLVVGPADSFRVDFLRVPLVIPLIQLGVNDDIWFTLQVPVNGAIAAHPQTYAAILTPGNYSGTDLAALIQAALASATSYPTAGVAFPKTGTTFAVSYNNHTASLAITCSDPSFHVLTDAEIKTLNTAYIKLPTFASALFNNTYSYSVGTTSTLTFNYCSVQAVDIMYLTSTRLSSADTLGPNGSVDTIMMAVPQSDFASVLLQSMSPEVFLNCPTISTSTLDFQLRDRNYNVLQNLPNISFVLTFK